MNKLITQIFTRIKQSNILRGFASTTLWGGLSKLIMLGVTFYCSNLLTPEGFGEFGFVKNTLNMLMLICAANFSSLSSKFAAESMQSKDSLKRLILLVLFIVGFSSVCAVIALVTPEKMIHAFTGGDNVARFVRVMCLLLPLFIIQPIVASMFRGYQQFNRVGIYETLVAVLFFILVVVGIHFWDYVGAIYAILLHHALNSIIGIIVLWHYNRKTGYITKVDELKSQRSVIWVMILPVFLVSFIEAPLTWLAQAEMGRRASYAMVGSLSVITSIRFIIQILPTYFYQAFIPHATLLFVNNNHVEYFKKYHQIANAFTILLFVIIPFLVLFGKFLLGLYGKAYIEQYPSFLVSLISIPLMLFFNLFRTNMVIREHQKSILWLTIISSIVFIVFFYFFILVGINVLDSFLYAQALQCGVQLLFSYVSYAKDKRVLLKTNF